MERVTIDDVMSDDLVRALLTVGYVESELTRYNGRSIGELMEGARDYVENHLNEHWDKFPDLVTPDGDYGPSELAGAWLGFKAFCRELIHLAEEQPSLAASGAYVDAHEVKSGFYELLGISACWTIGTLALHSLRDLVDDHLSALAKA